MTETTASLLPYLGVLKVSGDDRASFLHNQLSNDVNNLPASHACYATYNTPKGRVLANMLVLNTGDELWLIMSADLIDAVAKRLRMFVMRSKAVLENVSDRLGVASSLIPTDEDYDLPAEPPLLLNAEFGNGVWQIALPHAGVLCVGELAALPAHNEKAELQWRSHEINHGYPWIRAANSETCVAQMLNQHRLGGVHFRKGCYPGQEIIARAQYRGQVKRGLAVLTATTPEAAGIAVLQGGEEAGVILNSALTPEGSINLAVIKFAAAKAALTDADGNALALQRVFFDAE